MIGALEIIISVTSLLLVVLILLHRGKGGGLSDMFGGGFTSSFAGSSVVERNLDRFTLITAFIWFASIVGLLLLFKGLPRTARTKSVRRRVPRRSLWLVATRYAEAE